MCRVPVKGSPYISQNSAKRLGGREQQVIAGPSDLYNIQYGVVVGSRVITILLHTPYVDEVITGYSVLVRRKDCNKV
jgi:hypothetical protein